MQRLTVTAVVLFVFASLTPLYADDTKVDASVGVGYITADIGGANHEGPGAGFGIGAGRWVSDRVVVAGRLTALTNYGSYAEYYRQLATTLCIGPALQFWVGSELWVGGGVGLEVDMMRRTGNGFGASWATAYGLAVDLRPGIVLDRTRERSFYVAADVSMAFLTDIGRLNALVLQLGYERM